MHAWPVLFPGAPARTLIGAHRGASAEAPENTFAAFDLAVEQGADLLELDVHATSDNQLVVHHDPTLRRTAGSDVSLGSLTRAQLDQYDVGAWRGSQFRGQRIPSLDAVLTRYGHQLYLNVEIKAMRGPNRLIASVVAYLVRREELLDRVVVSSFHLATLETLRRVEPRLRVGVLAEDRPVDAILYAREIGAVAVHLQARAITGSAVDRAHALNLAVVAWTVDDPREMARLTGLGADAILSNQPARLAALRQGGASSGA
jgi:glycerophosphoryl diester phosphodiesterase